MPFEAWQQLQRAGLQVPSPALASLHCALQLTQLMWWPVKSSSSRDVAQACAMLPALQHLHYGWELADADVPHCVAMLDSLPLLALLHMGTLYGSRVRSLRQAGLQLATATAQLRRLHTLNIEPTTAMWATAPRLQDTSQTMRFACIINPGGGFFARADVSQACWLGTLTALTSVLLIAGGNDYSATEALAVLAGNSCVRELSIRDGLFNQIADNFGCAAALQLLAALAKLALRDCECYAVCVARHSSALMQGAAHLPALSSLHQGLALPECEGDPEPPPGSAPLHASILRAFGAGCAQAHRFARLRPCCLEVWQGDDDAYVASDETQRGVLRHEAEWARSHILLEDFELSWLEADARLLAELQAQGFCDARSTDNCHVLAAWAARRAVGVLKSDCQLRTSKHQRRRYANVQALTKRCADVSCCELGCRVDGDIVASRVLHRINQRLGPSHHVVRRSMTPC